MSTLPVNIDDRIVWDLWLAQFRFPVVSVADEVGTFAAITDRAKATAEIAAGLQLDAPGCRSIWACWRRWVSWSVAKAGGAPLQQRTGCTRRPTAMPARC
ncbi:MAG: hypothetical protein IPK59_22925 [Rhodospirillaceae bacterium]|nr:hypothetical protein [Rhodospirillaceae bacterium]